MSLIRVKTQNVLLRIAESFEIVAKRFRSAADKVIPENRVFLADCELSMWANVKTCFVLSTGRCGTLLLNKILQTSPDAYPLHVPKPELVRVSKRAYKEIDKSPEMFREVFKSAREEYLLKTARQGKVYIETNNKITFFAPIIKDVFPNTVFIHLLRHPGDFVRSGIRRQWYSGEHSHEVGRILPFDGVYKKTWNDLSQIQKIGWLWNETNQFIENFLNSLPADNHLTVKAEDLFSKPSISENIFSFLRLSGFRRNMIAKRIGKPENRQRKGAFPPFSKWSKEDKQDLQNMTPLASKFGYTF